MQRYREGGGCGLGVIVTVVHDEFRGLGLSGVQEFPDEGGGGG